MPRRRHLFAALICITLSPLAHAAWPHDADCINNHPKEAASIGHVPKRLLVDPGRTVLPSFANLPSLRA